MKFLINKQTLLEAISYTQKAITGKFSLPILQGILIKAEDSTVTMIGSDKDLTIETKFAANIKESGSVVVDAKLFGEIIRKLPNAEIEISTNENNTININCMKFKTTLLHLNSDEYPDLPQIEEGTTFTIPQKQIKHMIKGTIFAIAQEETRPIFTGVLFETSNKKLNLVALDGYRVAIRSEYIDSDAEVRKVIPGKTLNEVAKILEESDEVVDISFTDNHILFKIGETKVISRLLEGEFIQYNTIIPQEFKSKVFAKKEELLSSIERTSLMAKEGKTNLVKINIDDNNIVISSNSQLGTAVEEVMCELQGDTQKIAFNSKYLIDIFKILEGEEVQMELYSSVNPCVVKSKDSDNSLYMLLPVRVAE